MHNHSSRNNGNNELATDPIPPPPPDETNINVLKAQERELAHRTEVNEEVQRLRNEHAALVDRIRVAEMRAREANQHLLVDV